LIDGGYTVEHVTRLGATLTLDRIDFLGVALESLRLPR
jgi:hypothetical protein